MLFCSIFRRYDLKIITLKNEKCFASNCYILISETSFSVIDPSVSIEKAMDEISEIRDLKPRYVFLTHAHVDHMWGINSYVEAGAEVLVSQDDAKILSDEYANCAYILKGELNSYNGSYKVIKENDKIEIDNDFLQVIETPGHTKGSLSFLTDGAIFTGDTLFAGGSYGRYDLPTGNIEELRNSLRRLLSLPDELVIYSGHGEVSTIEYTKSFF